MKAVLAAARRFRAAIEVVPVALVSFEKFPAGSCGDASELLGEYLSDCGLGVWTYTMGVNLEAGRTHGWIEQDGVIADITADQFTELEAPTRVIVTQDHAWHDRYFESQSGTRSAGLAYWSGPTHDEVAGAYLALRTEADRLS